MSTKLVRLFNLVVLLTVMSTLYLCNFSSINSHLKWYRSRQSFKNVTGHLQSQRFIKSTQTKIKVNYTDEPKVAKLQRWNNYHMIPQLYHMQNKGNIIYIDLEKFQKELQNTHEECKGIHNPLSLWKSQFSNITNFTADLDVERIKLASRCGGLLDLEFLTTPPKEQLYPFEVAYLSVPPVWNEGEVSSHLFSTIKLLGSRSSYTVGDTVSFVINIADWKGRPKVRGGDRIKVWIEDVEHRHSISAKIVDFDNGTYLATTFLPWAGNVRVLATLRNSREYIRALIYIQRVLKSTMTFMGAYVNSKASEAVPCSPFPVLPGFNKYELCNLTLINGNSPWFCGWPSKPELKCSDLSQMMYSKIVLEAPITPVETNLMKQEAHINNFIVGTILLNVEPDKQGAVRFEDPAIDCNKVTPRSTWHQTTPPGYLYNNTWKSFLCAIPEKTDPSCFKNINLIIYGDSNSRLFYKSIRKRTNCSEVLTAPEIIWHAPKICTNKINNFTVQYMPHSSPFHALSTKLVDFSFLQHPRKLFESIPSTGRYYISFNHYLHYSSHHISAYERGLIVLRDALTELLQRNPEVVVIFRAPHVAELPPFTFIRGDSLAEHIMTIQREIFQNLMNRVFYFPTWDFTIAAHTDLFHPACNDHIEHVMLQFLCGRIK